MVVSASPSHSVRANVQHVLFLMKQHNPVLCNDRVVSDALLMKKHGRSASVRRRRSSVTSTDSSTSDEELSELLLMLQDEFGQMSFEHQELTKLIATAKSDAMREDLERELEALVKRMEAKGEQIAKVRKHKLQLGKLRRRSVTQRNISSSQKTKDDGTLNGMNEVKVTTTVTTRGRNAGPIKIRPGEKSKESLQLLKDMQTLQTSLQRQDIRWDY
ncbi:centrosomal protein of 57 kDa-like [Protopterus annectens]|uniref:centrosomal protein of 57 kDa-like n=1 Tax=Protopterus annectens TaxID=7888 RepID=UPI001CFB6AF6|nr:centrosomal protein of 57 kDa-like [Protopterus annectens]